MRGGAAKVVVMYRNCIADGRRCRRFAEHDTHLWIQRRRIRTAPNLRSQHVQVRADLAHAHVSERLEPVGDGQVQAKHAVHVHVVATERERVEHGAEVQRALAPTVKRVRLIEAAVRDRVDDWRTGLIAQVIRREGRQ